MHIYGPSQIHGPHPLSGPHQVRSAPPAQRSASAYPVDEIQISDQARLVEEAGQLPDIRLDKVNELRAQIAAGTYETADKLDVALDRLLDEIA